jgi:hypothetical protein
MVSGLDDVISNQRAPNSVVDHSVCCKVVSIRWVQENERLDTIRRARTGSSEGMGKKITIIRLVLLMYTFAPSSHLQEQPPCLWYPQYLALHISSTVLLTPDPSSCRYLL